MKKSVILTALCAMGVTFCASAFDQQRFDSHTAFYNAHKDDGKAIVILLSPFNTDNGIKEAFVHRQNGDVTKWQDIVNRLKKVKPYEAKIDVFSYMGSCTNSVTQANLMWTLGASVKNWADSNDFNVTQFNTAKKTFQDEFAHCKQVVRTPPDKKDYEETLLILDK